METPQQQTKHTKNHFAFTVEKTNKSYAITLSYKNPRTTRTLKTRFALMVSPNFKESDKWNKNVVAGAALHYFSSSLTHQKDVIGERKKTKRELGLGVYHILKNITRRKGGDVLLSELEAKGKSYLENPTLLSFGGGGGKKRGEVDDEERGDDDAVAGAVPRDPLSEQLGNEIRSKATPIPFHQSIFIPEKTGVTYAMIGKSFSGKTTFIVNELNKLSPEQLKEYNAIIFFTESAHAQPLSDLAPHVKSKMILIDRFCPIILQTLKRLNDASNLLFKFLVLFDDIMDLRGQMVTKCILTFRNSNISTVLSVQYQKMMNPAQRTSIHNMFIFNLRSECWEYLLKGYLLGTMRELFPNTLMEVKSCAKVAQLLRENMDPFIVYYNQREDKTEVWNKR